MKRFLFSFFLLLTAAVGRAHDFKVDGIYYNITSTEELTVEVTYEDENSGDDTDWYTGSVVIPEMVTYDGVTYSVTSIGESAFQYCSGLTFVTIPNSVISIGDYAFRFCTGLTSVTIPDGVIMLGQYAFENCRNLTSVIIGNGVTTISKGAFHLCKCLAYVTIGNSVTEIGREAFSACSNLKDIYCFADQVPSIFYLAFAGKDLYYVTLHVPFYYTEIYSTANGWSSLGKIESMSDDFVVNGIYYSVIHDDSEELSVSVSYRGYRGSYYGNIVIPETVTYKDMNFRVEEIGNNAFVSCEGLISVVIPNSVTSIIDNAFSGCTNMASVTIGDNVKTIGDRAFSYCYSLTSVIIPNSVTKIGERTFAGCEKLTSVTLGSGVTEIGYMAFYWLAALKDVYCFAETVPNADSSIFYREEQSSVTLHVPAASLEAYSTTEPWSSFGQIVAIDGGDGIEQLTSEEFTYPTVYDLGGRRVSKPRKGIYVIGGRKTVVK